MPSSVWTAEQPSQSQENLDDYFYESNQRTAKEVTIEELKFSLDEKSRSILQKHVNLFPYGQALIAENTRS